MGLAKMESGVACFTIATLISMATRMGWVVVIERVKGEEACKSE